MSNQRPIRRRSALLAAFAAVVLGAAPAAAQTAPEPATVIHAGALLDRPGQAPRGASTLVVRGGKVERVADGHLTAEAAGGAGARLVDLSDQFVLPGLIDMHVHTFSEGEPLRMRLQAPYRDHEDFAYIGADSARKMLEAGFTTVRDLGSEGRAITSLRDAINAGMLPGPTIVPAGRMISATAGHGDANGLNRDLTRNAREIATHLCDGPDSCRRAVREQVFQGAEVIKFAATGGVLSNIAAGVDRQLLDEEMKAIVETAHLLGLKATAHAHSKAGIEAALRAGVDSIEHGSYTDDETIALFKRTGAWLVPTMLAPDTAAEQARSGQLPPAAAAKALKVVDDYRRHMAHVVKSGVKIAFGTDTGVSHPGDNAKEFALLVQAGMSPAQAIKSATVDAAELLGRSDRLGTLEPGKDADIVAVAASPLREVQELEHPTFVMRRGVVHVLNGRRQAFPPQ